MSIIDTKDAINIGGLVRPANNMVALIGHSMHDRAINQVVSGGQIRLASLETRAWPAWASMLSKGRYVFPENCKFAVSSTGIADISDTILTSATNPSGFGVGKTQLQAAIDCPASTIAILTGHNDRFSPYLTTLAANIVKMTAIIQALTAAGKSVLLLNEVPTGSTAVPATRLTGQQLAYHLGWSDWCNRRAPLLAPGQVVCADTFSAVVELDPAATAGDAIAAALIDGIHPSSYGAYLMALKCIKALDTLGIPYVPPAIYRRGEVFSADNPSGSLLGIQGLLADAGAAWSGNLGGITYAGVKPANLNGIYPNAAMQAGTLTMTGAMVTTKTGRWFQVRIQGTTVATAGPGFTITPNSITLANVAAGDVLASFGEFEIDPASSGMVRDSLATIRNLPSSQSDLVQLGYNTESLGANIDAVLARYTDPMEGTFNGELTQTVSGTETSISTYLDVSLMASKTIDVRSGPAIWRPGRCWLRL